MACKRLLGLLLIFAAGLGGASAAAPDAPSPAAADRDLLRQVTAAEQVATSAPTPGPLLYLGDVGRAFSSWLGALADRHIPSVAGTLEVWLTPMVRALLVLLLLTLAVVVVRAALRRRRSGSGPPQPEPTRVLPAAAAPRRDAAEWEAEVDRRLAARDPAAAVAAVWWWLAARLATDAAAPSWTSRELISRAGRRDLAPQVGRLDRLIYGAAAPTPEDVRTVLGELREAVG